MTTKLLVAKWGMFGLVVASASVTEMVCGQGRVSWGIGFWAVVGTALWGASAGSRTRKRMEPRIRKMNEKKLPPARIAMARDGATVISMLAGSGVAYWGIVIRFILHGTRWQAMPFYMLGLALLFLWGPTEAQQIPAESNA